MQNLYEKKLVTYPRTDSRFLTEDMEHSLSDLVDISLDFFDMSPFEKPVNTVNVINNKKVSDHHAIIITKNLKNYNTNNLSIGEREILNLVNLRLLSALGDVHKYLETLITAKYGNKTFTTKGKVVTQKGFKQFLEHFEFEVSEDEELESAINTRELPQFIEGEIISDLSVKVVEGKTSPPKQFTEDTLLYHMERAGQGEEITREFQGLGTPLAILFFKTVFHFSIGTLIDK